MPNAIDPNINQALGFPYISPDLCFRPPQLRAISANLKYLRGAWPGISYDPKVLVNNAPTGTGKTLLGIATARLYVLEQPDCANWQIVYVVSTKSLQDQVVAECPRFADLRGRSNYTCTGTSYRSNCQVCSAYCGEGIFCTAAVASREARSTPYVVTNYAMWFTYGLRFGAWRVPMDPETKTPLFSKFFVIMDEAHNLDHELTNALEIKLSHTAIFDACDIRLAQRIKDMFPWKAPEPLPRIAKQFKWDKDELKPWVEAAGSALLEVDYAIESVKAKIEDGQQLHGRLSKLLDLQRNLSMLKYVNPREWVLDPQSASEVKILCATLKSKVEPLLIQNANKIMLMSATVSSRGLASLGFAPTTIRV